MSLRVVFFALLLASCGGDPQTIDPNAEALPVLLLATQGVTFGNIDRACGHEERRFCVENRASVGLTIENLNVAQDGDQHDFTIARIDGDLSVAQVKGKKLEAGARICFDVQYAPADAGIDNAKLEVKLEGFAEALAVEIGGSSEVAAMRTDTFLQGGTSKLDFLFVLDNSTSMSDVNSRVYQQLEQMFDQIAMMYDYRVAVTTADPSFLGNLVPYNENQNRIISATDADPRGEFSSRIRVEAASSTDLRAFESAFRVLSSRPFQTGSFLRADANLVLVWISDRDDQSEGPVELYGSFFSRIPEDRMRTVFSVAFVRTGFEQFLCTAADPPTAIGSRFLGLSQSLPGTADSVCSDFYANALFSLPGSVTMGFFILTSVPKVSSIQVTVQSMNGDEHAATGWHYEPTARAIVFDFQQPPIGSTLKITYEVECG